MSLRETLEAAERQTGKRSPELDGPPLPDVAAHVWAWWCEIRNGQSFNGMVDTGPSHLDIMAWQFNTGINPAPWEMRALMAISSAWSTAKPEKPETSTAPALTPDILALAKKPKGK